jgi:hypothetical protein
VQELSLHVQQDHLQILDSRAATIHPKPAQNESEASLATTSHEADTDNVTEVSRDDQIAQLQSSYSSLKGDLVRMKEEITRSDQQAQDLSTLYSAAIESSEENIKRLEAQLEWEMKKWDQYREETRRMIALGGGNEVQVQVQQPAVTLSDDNASTIPEHPDGGELGSPQQDDYGFDKPMEAQSQNSIQTIQKLLITAREKQVRLEQQNQELVSKRKALDSEHALLDLRYRETLAQLASLEAKDHDTAEALRNRAKGVEQCRATIDQEQEQSRKTVGELQSKIDELRQGTLSSSPPPHLSPLATAVPVAGNSVQESDTNGDHIMTESTPPPPLPLESTPPPLTTPVSTLPSQAEPLEGLPPMSVESEPLTAAALTLEPTTVEPLDEPQQPIEPVESLPSLDDHISAEPPIVLSAEQPVEISEVQMTQEQQEQQSEEQEQQSARSEQSEQQPEQPITKAPTTEQVNPDTSSKSSSDICNSASVDTDINTTATIAPVASSPTLATSPAPVPAPADATCTSTYAAENGASTSTSSSSTEPSFAPEKIQTSDESLPIEEQSVLSPKAPMSASVDINSHSSNDDASKPSSTAAAIATTTSTTTTTGNGNDNGNGDINDPSNSVDHLVNKDN